MDALHRVEFCDSNAISLLVWLAGSFGVERSLSIEVADEPAWPDVLADSERLIRAENTSLARETIGGHYANLRGARDANSSDISTIRKIWLRVRLSCNQI